MNNTNVGFVISKLRKKQGYTQKQLAEKLNVSDKAVSKWERGCSLPDITIIDRLSKILDIDSESLLEGQVDTTARVKWIGVLNVSNNNLPMETKLYNKEIIIYQIGYFFLLGISDIYIICKSKDVKPINKIVNANNLKVNFVSDINSIKNENIMYIDKPFFIYGQNISRHLQKASERTNGVTVLVKPSAFHNDNQVFFDYEYKVTKSNKNAIKAKYQYEWIPIMFIPKHIFKNISLLKSSELFQLYKRENCIHVEPMLRGIIYIPITNHEDVIDSSKLIEIIEKRDFKIGEIEEIKKNRNITM